MKIVILHPILNGEIANELLNYLKNYPYYVIHSGYCGSIKDIAKNCEIHGCKVALLTFPEIPGTGNNRRYVQILILHLHASNIRVILYDTSQWEDAYYGEDKRCDKSSLLTTLADEALNCSISRGSAAGVM